MKPVLGAMTNLYHFNHHLKQGVIHIPSTFTSKTSVTEWISGRISEFNESTFTNKKIFAIIPGLNNPAMLPTHK